MIIGGVDPGLVCTGYAYCQDMGDTITHAGMVRGDASMGTSERVVDIASRLALVMPKCDVLYVESMRYRPGAKVNPSILLALNLLAGSCMQLLAPDGELHFVEPSVWKGNVEKSVHHSRINVTLTAAERKILESLKPASLVHNVRDGVGLCLFATGRLTPQTRSIKK